MWDKLLLELILIVMGKIIAQCALYICTEKGRMSEVRE